MIKDRVCIDRYLPTVQARINAAKTASAENPANIPAFAPSHIRPLGLALLTDKKWAIGRQIDVFFMGGSHTQKSRLEERFRIIEQYANLTFKVTDNPKSVCRIAFMEGQGSWSWVGPDNEFVPYNQPTMNFGWLFDDTSDEEYDSTGLHEILHLCGFCHEQSSPTADFFKWNKPAVYSDLTGPPNNWTKEEVDWNVFEYYSRTVTQYSQFDPYSIMLYAMPSHWFLDGFSTPWNITLSETDKKYLTKFYPFSDIKINGEHRRLRLTKNILKQLNLVLSPEEAGLYTVGIQPDVNSWLSLTLPNGNTAFSKDPISINLPPGKTVVKLRNEVADQACGVYCRSKNN